MRLTSEQPIFIGCKVSNKLREALDTAGPDLKTYFEGPESPYLRICDMGSERWIGKIVDAGLQVNRTEDLRNNIISILKRIAPGVRHSTSDVKIFAVAAVIIRMPSASRSTVASSLARNGFWSNR